MNNNIINLKQALGLAPVEPVTADDILDAHQLAVIDLVWPDEETEIKNEIKRIKHERALEKFAKKAA